MKNKELRELKESLERDGRRKIVYIPTRYIIDVFARGMFNSKFVSLPDPVGLPKTAKAISSHYDYQRNAFAIIVQDDSFEVCPEGELYPVLDLNWQSIELQRKPNEH